jgi:threo-3-hydroxy-L-aspartate ammonia-lyase
MDETADLTPASAASAPAVTLVDVEAAAARLQGVANRTPVLTSRSFNQTVGAEVFFKCENLQRAGAFKFRGAYNALAQLSDEERSRGVITYSSGNHAQAVALAARLLKSHAVIVMPEDAPATKTAATRAYGGEVQLYDRRRGSREEIATAIAAERGLTLIPPFNHPSVIAGQGTAALELFEQAGPLDYLLVCVGGGGLISGCAVATAGVAPGCRVIGVEPEAGDDATRSFRSGVLQSAPNAEETIADGARTATLGSLTFALIMRHVHDMLTVPDSALLRMMSFFLQRMKLVVEPTGALAAAALLEGALRLPGARIGVIVSGGNVDLRQLAALA